MEPKKIALLVGALVVALVTALMARSMMMKSATPSAIAMPKIFAPTPTGPKVLVATRPLPVGTILDDSSYKYQPWPKDLIQGAYYVDGKGGDRNDLAVLRGSVVRTAVSAGQPITMGSVVQPGDRGFLAAALGPGMRAITVQVNAVTGVAGFVFPGDRVDLMLTSTIDGQGGPTLKTAETIVRNLRVLAADSRTTSEDKDGKKVVTQTNTVTLETTPRIAEKIQVSMAVGSLSLSLRPIAESAAELERAIASGEVNVPKGNDPQAERIMRMSVADRPSDTNTSFVTGGDVSRFQRRSVAIVAGSDRAPPSPVGQPRNGFVVVAKPRSITVANGTSVSEVIVGVK